MGTNLDVFLEVENCHVTGFQLFGHFDLPRYVQLYALLGSRSHVAREGLQPVFALRGLPNDLDENSLEEMQKATLIDECPMISWLTFEEVSVVWEHLRIHGTHPEFFAILVAMQSLQQLGFRTRLVYCFDQ